MKILCLLSLSLVFGSCSWKGKTQSLKALDSQRALAIATSEPLATAAAEEVFLRGGNIADAAVAASFAIAVVRPQSTGIGGGGFLMAYFQPKRNEKGQKPKTILPQAESWDFRETAPRAAKPQMFVQGGTAHSNLSQNSALAVATPGMVAGLYAFHQKHGRLSWLDVLEPSIRLAFKGIPVSQHMIDSIEVRRAQIALDPVLSATFLPNGRPPQKGSIIYQKDLGNTLQKIRELGPEGFYEGSVARAIVEWITANGGILSNADLKTYRVKMRDPVKVDWNKFQVLSMPPPSSGGLVLAQIFKITEELMKESSLKLSDDYEVDPLTKEIEAFKRAYADRAQHLGDSDFHPVPVKELLSADYMKARARDILDGPIKKAKEVLPWSKDDSLHQTTHLSFLDNEGNAISTTQSLNMQFGVARVVPGTGVILNNTMDDFSIQSGVANNYGLVGGQANEVRGKKRPLSSMTPTIVLDSTGSVIAVAGAPGGSRIITGVYVTLSRFLRDGMEPGDAIGFCRFHHQWLPDKVFMEPQCPRSYKDELSNIYQVEESEAFGEVQLTGFSKEGALFSVVDPRGHGISKVITAPKY